MRLATMPLAAISMALLTATAAHSQSTGASRPTVALKGYDTVSYFKESRAVMGLPEFGYEWDGVRYQFSSVQNKAAFTADPDRYTPAFAALCATGVSMGKKVEADPTVWKIVNGTLYVFSSKKARDVAEADPAVLVRSSEVWPKLK